MRDRNVFMNYLSASTLVAFLAVFGLFFISCEVDLGLSKSYTVTFDSNGGTGYAPAAQTANSGSSITLPFNSGLSKTGYTFGGWNTNNAGTGTSYAAGSLYTVTGNATLYAKWESVLATSYTVTYNANNATGGTVPVDSKNYTTGQIVTVLVNSGGLTRTGYTFAGWNTASNGTGMNYAAGNTFNMGSGNVTLYAMWAAIGETSYTVTYNANNATGGTVPFDSNNYATGQTVTVLGNSGSLVRTGYTFAGWNTGSGGTGTSYAAGSTLTMGSRNVILYAKWTANNYTVTYNANGATGGTVPTGSNNYATDQTVTVLGNSGSLTRTGYTFAGWNTASDGSGRSYAAGSTFAMSSSNITLFAKWEAVLATSYTVTYNANGATSGTVPTDWNDYTTGQTVTVLGNSGSLTRTGYTFAGWSTASNGTGMSYAAGSTLTMGSGNVTLYAKWVGDDTRVPYIVPTGGSDFFYLDLNASLEQYDLYSGGGIGRPLVVTSANSVTYTFDYFNQMLWIKLTADQIHRIQAATEVRIQIFGTATPNSQFRSCLAKQAGSEWNLSSWLGGSSMLQFSSVTTETGLYPTRGSFDDIEYLMLQMQDYVTTAVTISAIKVTLVPGHTVTYNANGATGGTVPVDLNNYAIGQTVTVLGNSGGLTRTGYTFAGWNTANGGTGTSYAAGSTLTMGSGNVTLYAKWVEATAQKSFTITFAQIADAAPFITGPTLYRASNGGPTTATLTVDNYEQYSYISWQVNSTAVTGTGNAFTLDAANTAYNQIGERFITVMVFKDGIPYNKTISFNIEY